MTQILLSPLKKGKSIGHAESADLVLPSNDHCSVAQASGQAHEETEQDLRAQDMPEHLKQMYKDNISDLSANEKEKLKQVLIDYQDVFSRDDFDLGCLFSGVEHKI